MLEYCKKILTAMTFDLSLFKKELTKCFSYIDLEDRIQLGIWLDSKYAKLPTNVTFENRMSKTYLHNKR